jgi:hypothetical protein
MRHDQDKGWTSLRGVVTSCRLRGWNHLVTATNRILIDGVDSFRGVVAMVAAVAFSPALDAVGVHHEAVAMPALRTGVLGDIRGSASTSRAGAAIAGSPVSLVA